MTNHMQPVYRDVEGRLRFKENECICYMHRLLRSVRPEFLDEICSGRFPRQDVEQFYQLIGYTICGYGELSVISEDSKDEAERLANEVGS